VSEWQPIETCPKNWGFTTFDVYAGERIPDCWWGIPTYGKGQHGVVYQASYDSDGPVIEYVRNATHWMPLPKPPTGEPQYQKPTPDSKPATASNPDAQTHEQA